MWFIYLKIAVIEQTKRSGRTDEYRVLPTREWVAREELDNIRQSIINSKKEQVNEGSRNEFLPSEDSSCDK